VSNWMIVVWFAVHPDGRVDVRQTWSADNVQRPYNNETLHGPYVLRYETPPEVVAAQAEALRAHSLAATAAKVPEVTAKAVRA
jgi:hypothetical protein